MKKLLAFVCLILLLAGFRFLRRLVGLVMPQKELEFLVPTVMLVIWAGKMS